MRFYSFKTKVLSQYYTPIHKKWIALYSRIKDLNMYDHRKPVLSCCCGKPHIYQNPIFCHGHTADPVICSNRTENQANFLSDYCCFFSFLSFNLSFHSANSCTVFRAYILAALNMLKVRLAQQNKWCPSFLWCDIM